MIYRPPDRDLDLPPGFTLVTLREHRDAFDHAYEIAAEAGAGTLVWVRRYDLVEFAVVLEPDEALTSARRAHFAVMGAMADAISSHCPPERQVSFAWPDRILFDGALIGGARLGWPEACDETQVPDWLVASIMLRAADMSHVEAGHSAEGTSLMSEGFELVDTEALIGSFARHLMTAFDRWREHGFKAVAEAYFERLPKGKAGERRGIDVNGDLLVHAPLERGPAERTPLVPALEKVGWLDPAHGAPRLG